MKPFFFAATLVCGAIMMAAVWMLMPALDADHTTFGPGWLMLLVLSAFGAMAFGIAATLEQVEDVKAGRVIGRLRKRLAVAYFGDTPSRFRALEARVHAWAESRGIYASGTPLSQLAKTREECDELWTAVRKKDAPGIRDGIGDVLVTLVIQCRMQGVDILDCLEEVLGVIESRQGRMVDGAFVKDAGGGK